MLYSFVLSHRCLLASLYALPLVEMTGLEPVNPLLAKQVLSQLSYTPIFLLQGFAKTLKIEQRTGFFKSLLFLKSFPFT